MKTARTIQTNVQKLVAQAKSEGISVGDLLEAPDADFASGLEQVRLADVGAREAVSRLQVLKADYLDVIQSGLQEFADDPDRRAVLVEMKAKRADWKEQLPELEDADATGRQIKIEALNELIFEAEVFYRVAQTALDTDPDGLQLPMLRQLDEMIREAEDLIPKPAVQRPDGSGGGREPQPPGGGGLLAIGDGDIDAAVEAGRKAVAE